MKKILFVVTDRKMGGVSIVLEDVLNNLPQNKYKIDLLILNNEGNRLEGYIDKNINVIYGTKFFKAIDTPLKYFKKHLNIPLLLSKLSLIFSLKTGFIKNKLKKERAKLKLGKYDVEIAFKDGFPAIFTAIGDTPKKVHWLHSSYGQNDPTRRYRKVFKSIYDNFDTIISVSPKTTDDFNSHYHQEDKCLIVKNIIDDVRIKKAKEPIKKLSNKKINFISVGRLATVKGYDILLKIIAKLKQEGLFDDCFLTLVGDGPLREDLIKMAKEHEIQDCIGFAGNQSNPYPYLAGADMYISSSREESFGLSMVEALILGVPVLATETSATSDIIQDRYNGVIVPNNEEALYHGLKEIISKPKLLEELKENAQKYDYSKTNAETIKTIDNILSN